MASWFRRLLRQSAPNDGEAIYDRIEGGQPIPLDDEEREWIRAEIESDDESIGDIIGAVESDGRYLPDHVLDSIASRSMVPTVVRALRQLAYQRYEDEQFLAAANTCIRAMGFGAKDHPSLEPEFWHILARIHATVGRFETAAGFLDLAEKRAEQARTLDNLPAMLRDGWVEGGRSLREDISAGRSPRPTNSVYVQSSVNGWFETSRPVS